MKYLRQIIFEMKHQKMMTWVSISGIALSVFLVMVCFMINRLPLVEAAPESNRSRMLYGGGLDVHAERWSQSGGMSYPLSEKLYGNLDGIEKIARSSAWEDSYNVGIKGKISNPMDGIKVDTDFWNMYDFKFISGKPFDKASMEAGEKVVVLTRSVARKIFGKEEVAGEEVNIDAVPYRITGVVEDVNPIMKATFSNIYLPFEPETFTTSEDFDGILVHLLMKPGVTEDEIKAQVKARFTQFNAEKAKVKEEVIYHNDPHDAEIFSIKGVMGNWTPDLKSEHRGNYILYVILILLPAINLSCMMRGRLRHRVSEIGVRRAYGAKKSSIISQILGENLIVTLIGGIVGFALSMVFIYFAADYFFSMSSADSTALEYSAKNPSFSMLFTWTNFIIALAVCFVLNLLSAFLPAWKASRVEPAVAIAKSR